MAQRTQEAESATLEPWRLRDFLGPWRRWAIEAAVAAGGAVWMAFMAPFGTVRASLAERLTLQLTLAAFVVLIYGVFGRVGLAVGRRYGWPAWACLMVAVVLASVPMSAIVAWQVTSVLPAAANQAAWMWFAQTVLITLPGAGLYAAALHVAEKLIPRARPSEGPCRLARRLPLSLGGEICALQAEDHYVRVFTPRGSHLIHMRLSDAIAELDGQEGLQVHRSWWVARSGAVAGRLKGRQPKLLLANGVEAPVARKAAPKLKEAGWSLQQL